MSSHSSRLPYDQAAYEEKVRISTDPAQYRLDPNYAVNCGRCFAPYGPRGIKQAFSAPGFGIDIDSIMSNRTVINTKSARHKYPTSLEGFTVYQPGDCDPFLESEYSRFTDPIQKYRGLTRDPFYPLNHDPQCHIFWDFSVNTRLQAKDNHKAIFQTPLNQRDLMPTERLGPKKDCNVNLNCNFAPYESS